MAEIAARLLQTAAKRDPDQKEFLQAVKTVVEGLIPLWEQRPELEEVMARLIEPERIFTFRVAWLDDHGKIQINRGFRVQYNSAIGPYKGGLRFHPSVNLSIIKFLGFDQIFKNSLTTLPMGGGKGGSDFDPKGKSDAEVMRFCQSFMTELFRYIGPNIDIPAGDIGVGAREIGYMYGQYKRLTHAVEGVLTGKGQTWGGSLIRPEATGFGGLYFASEMVAYQKQEIAGKTICVSGFGNVAWGACLKAAQLKAKVITISGPDGYVYDEEGINTPEKIAYLLRLRATCQDIVAPYAEQFPKAQFFPGKKPWERKCDIALPCATQNELDANDAAMLHANGCKFVVELSNMGCTHEALEYCQSHDMIYAPGIACNAGGVAVSGLEMSQNSIRLRWKAEEVDQHLQRIMKDIHKQCVEAMTQFHKPNDYVFGANAAGFLKVATAMIEQGCV
ncbi:Glutamate dehydrogenase 2 [Monocercomonoides exilis]|uniref:Glutamate dehydrogenase 2 n=1 Tax=Monocercomonoides exilis TaxID=2049356 RepID=UPI00355941EF|nr:Glutamate dehydrogenase 2 [Monocercomonoides exilis]|eukprot:MONOS_3400.1-p1 / transcript=MONOS_3400.1 / gene=MONOS_3400 / organism=Monocercomonoides_exilis_PA203 / gene_product=Glutamate dehydrogenase 2 / transcript_product=Glutamate dehydrogenase 2 / location=Mono_scaffold00080:19492-20932(-) / protein_length=447 / sequence_SO=supercontig / SO=protein_coding / is_pseudo=false